MTAALAVVVVGLLAWLGWAWRHPTALGEHSDSYGFRSPRAPGEALWVSAVVPALEGDPVELRIHSVSPRVTGTRGADITAWVCDVDFGSEQDPGERLAFGSGGDDDARRYCTSLVPAAGADLTLSPNHREQLLLRIQLDRPGVVKFDGADVRYSDGWQTGAETIGPHGVVRVKPTK